jgi:type IV secretory pathway VirB4 component
VVVKTKRNPGPQGQDGTTQRHLPFSQIRENVIIMKDGSARVVLKCTTINFLLKSTEEQDSIIISFQRFLNSLDFPVQIMVRSSKLDINGYLDRLQMMAVKQQNALLQNQTYEYIEYLRKLVEVAQIMKKEFYIVVPYDTIEGKSVRDTDFLWPIKSFWRSINGAIDVNGLRSQIRNFANMKKWVFQRVNSVKTALEAIGIRWIPLEKAELIKFLTEYYNPSLDNITPVKEVDWKYNVIW